MSEKPHPLARRYQDFQRKSTRTYICPLCKDEPGFQQEPKLWEHAIATHPQRVRDVDVSSEGSLRKQFAQDASDKAKRKARPRAPPALTPDVPNSLDGNASVMPIVREDVNFRSPSQRPLSASEKRIGDFGKLSIEQGPDLIRENNPGNDHIASTSTELKRAATEDSALPNPFGKAEGVQDHPRNRRANARSGELVTPRVSESVERTSPAQEADFTRDRAAPHKRLFNPNTDQAGPGFNLRKSENQDPILGPHLVYDARAHVFRSKKEPPEDRDFPGPVSQHLRPPHQPINIEKSRMRSEKPTHEEYSRQEAPASRPLPEGGAEQVPEMVLQPETRPISHEQLVVEVKGIYAGLVMVEAKCIDVDEKQSNAAQEKNVSRRPKLTNEQWQALIALHKTLLHEHLDFFLASQHPSASTALSRLAARYSMPARMWRHGIHAFLEVLRHRLPESLDHMLAFIYIAYSIMALLYETITAFKETWIECLGDLGRYRMAIEDDDIRDREVWSGVARHWYAKAADTSPNIGRLYHHLAILARPYTLQQLSFYTRSLTCIQPFESAKGSIMTLFDPILEGKESAYHRSSSTETIIIKAHGLLFTQRSLDEFDLAVKQLLDGLLHSYIGRVTTKFKENGVFAALSNISSLFEYGIVHNNLPRSIFRLAYEELRSEETRQVAETASEKPTTIEDSKAVATSTPSAALRIENLTQDQIKSSLLTISRAASLTFGTFAVALRRTDDKNVYPMIHVYCVFLWSLTGVEKAIRHVEKDIPWVEICSFLNALAEPEAMNPKLVSAAFPVPDEGIGRPLPEDFDMRGQPWTKDYFPNPWFKDAMVDDEERSLELPSMAEPRVERIRWLGHRIASANKWIRFDAEAQTFSTTPHADELRARAFNYDFVPGAVQMVDRDSIMSGVDDSGDESERAPDSPGGPQRRDPTIQPPLPVRQSLDPGADDKKMSRGHDVKTVEILKKPQTTDKRSSHRTSDVDMIDLGEPEYEKASPPLKPMHQDSAHWLGYDKQSEHRSPPRTDKHDYPSDPKKLESLLVLDPLNPTKSNKA